MSEGTLKTSSDALVERRRIKSEPDGRDWGTIGIGLAAAFALIALYGAVIWAVWVVVEAVL